MLLSGKSDGVWNTETQRSASGPCQCLSGQTARSIRETRTRTLVETKVKASWRTCREVQAFDVILLK